MKSARVRDFAFILVGLLTQYDQKEGLRELKRGGRENIYRLGHLLKAADKAEVAAKRAGIWERDDHQAIVDYRYILQKYFIYEYGPLHRGVSRGQQFALSPLRQLDKKMKAWIEHDKLPTYGKLRSNPWEAVFE